MTNPPYTRFDNSSVADRWNDSYRRAPSDGSAWLRGNCDRRVLRGGPCGNSPRVSACAPSGNGAMRSG